ncbi:MFS transporter [Coraliomargarita algicola]|uniref:MFS transporter n=1 Tax=Coraliomargarita algicola TaxID=3092156 RepID=A0ABZ0RPF1_9BACT|nr:MFS transporter [Coraliomargarita sp. J2-16]WPJ97018.1 MFS transporter [Coraliomargarita sp. J2-16]
MSKNQNLTKDVDKVSLAAKAAFGGGIVCVAMGANGLQIIGKPVLNIIYGMDPAVIGLILAVMRIWDGLLDPIMGRVSDNSRLNYGRRKPYIIIGSVLTGLVFPLIWWMDPNWSDFQKSGYFFGACLLFYACFTVVSVPYNTLSVELTPDYSERSRVRAACSVANVFIFIVYGWTFSLTQMGWFESPEASMRVLAVVIALFMIIFGVFSGVVPQERYRKLAVKQEKVSIFKSFKEFLCDRNFLLMKGIGLGIVFGNNIVGFLAQYVEIFYVFEGNLVKGAMFSALNMTLLKLMELLTIFLLVRYFMNYDKRKVIMVLLGITIVGVLAKWFLYNPNYPYLIFVSGFYMGPITAGFWMLYSSLQSDYPDYDEYKNGLRREGTYSALGGWLVKVTVAIAMVCSGVILNITGFDQELRGDQPENTFLLMRILMILLPFLFYSLSFYCLVKFALTKEKMQEIRDTLEERRNAV